MALTPIERLDKIAQHTNMSWRAIAQKGGLTTSQVFTDIRAKRSDITARVATAITKAMPEINFEWLLTGEGEMLNEQRTPMTFFGKEYINGDDTSVKIDFSRWLSGADFTVIYNGEDMMEYKPGEILIMKELDGIEDAVPGKNYLFEIGGKRIIRTYHAADGSDEIMLYSSNTSCYPDGIMKFQPVRARKADVTKVSAIVARLIFDENEFVKMKTKNK